MLRHLKCVVYCNLSPRTSVVPTRSFSHLTNKISQLGCTSHVSTSLFHSKRQVQRSHTKESLAIPADNNTSSLKSVYQNVKETVSRISEKTEPFSQTTELSLRYISVQSLRNFYFECPNGVVFDVCYVDSHPDGILGRDVKTILVLPGSPGTHVDVLPLMRPLVRAGYRVVTVNFPGYGKTNSFIAAHDFVFRGATDEKSDFVLQFLQELKIDKVDLLVAQGSGCYPAIDLAAAHTWIKALALICPEGHRVFKGISPYEEIQKMAGMYDSRVKRFLLVLWIMVRKYVQRRPNTQNVPVLSLMKSIIEAANYQFESMETNMFALVRRQLPLTFVYSGQDSHVETEVSEDLARVLQLQPEEFGRLDAENIIHLGKDKFPRGLFIEAGDHNPIKNQEHCDVIALMLLDELRRTTKASS